MSASDDSESIDHIGSTLQIQAEDEASNFIKECDESAVQIDQITSVLHRKIQTLGLDHHIGVTVVLESFMHFTMNLFAGNDSKELVQLYRDFVEFSLARIDLVLSKRDGLAGDGSMASEAIGRVPS